MHEMSFTHREECRKCDATVWVTYFFTPEEAGWSVKPIGTCGNPNRCGEKVQGLGNEISRLLNSFSPGPM